MTGTDNLRALPSVDDVKLDEERGSGARAGPTSRDEVAASFMAELLDNQSLVRVHCETQGDVVLAPDGGVAAGRRLNVCSDAG